MPTEKILDLNEVFRIANKNKKYTDALIGLLEDTIDSYDYETAYSDDQKEAFEYWLRSLTQTKR